MVESTINTAEVAKRISDALSEQIGNLQGHMPEKSDKLQQLLPEKGIAQAQEIRVSKDPIQQAHRVAGNRIGTKVNWEA